MLHNRIEKLGSLLLRGEHISEKQLAEALALQQSVQKRLGDILVEMQALNEEELITAISRQINVPVADSHAFETIPLDLVGTIPEPFAREHAVVPLRLIGNQLEVAMADPENVAAIDTLMRLTGYTVKPFLAGRRAIAEALDTCYASLHKSGEMDTVMTDLEFEIRDDISATDIDLTDDSIAASDSPIVKIVNLILAQAIHDRATDIHIEPFTDRVDVRYRIDGALVLIMTPPVKSHAGIVARIKVMSQLNIAESRVPQDGRFSIRLADRSVDVRVSILPTVLGEKIVLRLLDKGSFNLSLQNIGFMPSDLELYRKYINLPYGIVIISGPTGSGKSTTLYSALNEIKSVEDNIVTVEDPVEYQIDGITQVAVNDKVKLTFAAALRSILRQDPDKVLIGEIRDHETADIAMKFALTGHLVFTTLHANDCAATLTRLIDIGVPPYLIGSSVVMVMAQRLVRTICPECKTEYSITDQECEILGIDRAELTGPLYHGTGCGHCKNTGYYGRTGIFEILPLTAPIRKLVFASADQERIKTAAVEQNMKTLRESAMEKLFLGITSVHEVLKRTVKEI
jgi:type IV pilus assembly protein PilB